MIAERLVWVPGDGGQPIEITHGNPLVGFHGPPESEQTESEYDGHPGAYVDDDPVDKPRDLFVPALLKGVTREDRQDQIRELARATARPRGARLQFTNRNGITREVRQVRLVSGLASLEDTAPEWTAPVLYFRAVDPYWHAVEQTEIGLDLALEQSYEANSATPFDDPNTGFDDPIPFDGLSGSGSSVSGAVQFELDNVADTDAEPIWAITGPFSLVEATNLRTGEVWSYERVTPAGRTVLIDTRLRSDLAVLLDSEDDYAALVRHQLWHLGPGRSQIRVRIIATGPETTVGMAWTPRHRTL